MKTFKLRDGIGPIKSEALYEIVIEYAKKHKLPFSVSLSKDDFKNYPVIFFGACGFDATQRVEGRDLNIISLEEFFEYCENYPKINQLRVVLNSDYTADISHETKTVTVGCQKIPFSKVEELYNKIKNK